MQSILYQLFNGEISPIEQFYPILEKHRELQKKNNLHINDFEEKLNESLKIEFHHIMEEQMEMIPFDFSQMFIDGFKLGMRMAIEVLDDKKC